MSEPIFDIETMTVAFARKEGFVGSISEVTRQTVSWVLERMAKTNGRTQVKRAFQDQWPDDAALGKFKVAQGLRLCLAPRLGRMLGRTPEDIEQQLRAAPTNTRLRALFGADWPT